MLVNKPHDIDFEYYGCFTGTKFYNSVRKSFIHFKLLKISSLLVCKYANIKMLFLLQLIILSIILKSSIVSLGSLVLLTDCSRPLALISSLLLISESRSFFKTCSSVNFVCCLVSSNPKNNKKS